MIYLWLKIIYYKITKALSGSWSTWCRIHAEAGTDEGVSRARHEALGVAIDPATPDGLVLYSREPGAPDDSIGSRKLRELISKGLVHEPDGLGDLRLLIEDQARLAEDRRRAFEQDYPGPLFFGLLDTRPSAEIELCPRCDHPQHGGNGGRCAFLVTGADTEGPLLVCRCTGG